MLVNQLTRALGSAEATASKDSDNVENVYK